MTRHGSSAVIVGAGHAGLSVSWFLRQLAIDHVVLEQHQIGDSWLTKRWDSFRLVSPNALIRLPGAKYTGAEPEGFMGRDAFVKYLVDYADSFRAPVCRGSRATRLVKKASGWCVHTSDDQYGAQHVVIATGGYPAPYRPRLARELSPDLFQLDAERYRNAPSLPPGAVLVVGSGQSGAQIAEELLLAGRTVYLSVGRCGRWPRRYRGRDIMLWVDQMEASTTRQPGESRWGTNAHLSGTGGGHEINLRRMGHEGLILVGRVCGASTSGVALADDLEENLLLADQRSHEIKTRVNDLISRNRLDALEDDYGNDISPGVGTPRRPIADLTFANSGIRTVIWATGYQMSFGWIDLPIFDADGFPQHRRGLCQEGLYFVGLPWLHTAASSGLIGISADASFIAHHIAQS